MTLPGCKNSHGFVLIDLVDEIVTAKQPPHHDQAPKTYTIPYKATILLWHIALCHICEKHVKYFSNCIWEATQTCQTAQTPKGYKYSWSKVLKFMPHPIKISTFPHHQQSPVIIHNPNMWIFFTSFFTTLNKEEIKGFLLTVPASEFIRKQQPGLHSNWLWIYAKVEFIIVARAALIKNFFQWQSYGNTTINLLVMNMAVALMAVVWEWRHIGQT